MFSRQTHTCWSLCSYSHHLDVCWEDADIWSKCLKRIVAGMLFRLKMSHIALILTRFRNGPQIEETQCRGVKGRLLPHSWWILGSGCGRVWGFIHRNLWLMSLLQNSTGRRPRVSKSPVFFSLLVPTDICRMYYGLNTWLHKIGEVKCIVQFHTYIIGTSCHMDFWFTLLLLLFFCHGCFRLFGKEATCALRITE